jgi:hypothetical protein
MSSFYRDFTLVLFLTFSVSLKVSAEANWSDEDNQTMFQNVVENFNRGEVLNLDKFSEKIVSGRCFHFENPNTPLAAYLVITKKMGDVGPLGASSSHYTGMMQEIAEVPPGYFDASNISVKDKHIYPARYPFVLKYTDTYVLNYPATGEVAYFRKNNEYIFSMVVDRFRKVDMVCYFFKSQPS